MRYEKTHGNPNNSAVSSPYLEQNFSNGFLGEKKIKRLDSQCSLHVHSLRHRLADPDGISGKAVIDGLVRVGLLSNDTPKEIKEVSFSQEKISTKRQEQTIITLTVDLP